MANTEGSTFKRCGCRDQNGKLLGAKCPKLKRRNGTWSSAHGLWGYQVELPRTATGTRRQARRTGMEYQQDALDEAAHVKNLLELAEGEPDTLVPIADLIQQTLKAKQPLPAVEEVKRRLGAGADLRAQIPTVAAWLQEWLSTKTDVAQSTWRSYHGHITNHLTPHLGQVRLDKLTATHINAMFAAIDERNADITEARDSEDPQVKASVRAMRIVALGTKHRIRATLRSALSEAIRRPDLPVQVNVASHCRLPAYQRGKPLVWTTDRVAHYRAGGQVPSTVMVWTPEQTAAFLDRARRDRLYPLFHLIAVKGLRRGEAVGLSWPNVRLTDQAIDICTQIVQLGWQTITTTPKSAAGQRSITLDAHTTRVLKTWRTRQARERLQAGDAWIDNDLVFTHPDGSALHPAWVSDLFHDIAREAGLPPIRLHDLRHGAASLSLAAGVDVKVVSAELGHATTAFTQDTYQHVYPTVAREAAEATAALLPLKQQTRSDLR
ncbi:tyrosine-type recombinase/integrase [Allosalinactinospora lopnorensis]|uniref:tyrosine-type recombinase/integrase n=1 Tax=Allosalinactinospora lopnorensis TaxID=1352348 RepID=UPI000623EDF0|nr:site-specific integrase [Allosalinactinospora lopnorensis]